MKVSKLMERLAKADPEARVNVTVLRGPGKEPIDCGFTDCSDDGDIFDIFIDLDQETWEK